MVGAESRKDNGTEGREKEEGTEETWDERTEGRRDGEAKGDGTEGRRDEGRKEGVVSKEPQGGEVGL
jgi:hypothetical protein